MHRTISLVVVLAALVAAAPAAAQDSPAPLSVTGHGRVEARPDRAEVTYALSRYGVTREAARGALATQAGVLLRRLRAVGVNPLGIRLSDVAVARRSASPGLRKPFVASAQIAARSDNVALAGRMLDLGAPIGADARGPVFDLVDDAAAREQATARAVADAQRRAAAVAAGLGLRIAGVRSVSLDGAPTPVASPVASPAPSNGAGPTTPTAPGVLSVTASVTVVYDLARG